MERLRIFDTTLRDGEQSPGFSMKQEQKLRFALQLEQLGVDVIEAGFPAASPGDLEGVRTVAKEIKNCRIAAMARAREDDVNAALRALEPAAQSRIHVLLATSDLHLKHKLRITRSEALDRVGKIVHYACQRCDEVEFCAEDASRSDLDFLCEVLAVAAQEGATILNLPDTVGYSVPAEYAEMFRRVRKHLSAHPNIVLSAHCHNDLGLAVANSLAAVEAGARQLECTVNGIGERAGNASLEEIVVAIHVRNKHYRVTTNVVLEKIYSASRTLSGITGVDVPPNKAVVGANAFAHEAGIHQDGILKEPSTYEIIDPATIGAPGRRLVFGKHSGRNALRASLYEAGCEPTESELAECYKIAIARADRGERLMPADLLSIVLRIRTNSVCFH